MYLILFGLHIVISYNIFYYKDYFIFEHVQPIIPISLLALNNTSNIIKVKSSMI